MDAFDHPPSPVAPSHVAALENGFCLLFSWIASKKVNAHWAAVKRFFFANLVESEKD